MATKLGDLTVAATTGAWALNDVTMTAGSKTVTLRRKSDGAVLATRSFTVEAASALSVSDSFDRANNASLGSDWTTAAGMSAPAIASNAASSASGYRGAYWSKSGDTFAANQFASAPITSMPSIGPGIGVCVRGSASGIYAGVISVADDGEGYAIYEANIHRVSSGGSLTSISGLVSLGYDQPTGTLRLEVSGTSLALKVNGSNIATATDSTYSSGAAGIFLIGAVSIASWAGGDL